MRQRYRRWALCILDQEKIAWGIASLVGNALRYVGGGSKRDRRVDVEARIDEPTRELVLSVHDNGPGIPEARRQYLLHPDPETKQATGLALLVLRDVVLAHGGRIVVTSTTGETDHGTTIEIRIPVGKGPAR